MSEDETYNGWKNYATWNVALWIGNNDMYYSVAMASEGYAEFCEFMERLWRGGFKGTPDHVAWDDSGLDIEALDEVITELKG